jgi:hypothetical protein
VIGLAAPTVVTIPMPEGAHWLKIESRLDLQNPEAEEATVQWAISTDQPRDVTKIMPGVLTIWKRATKKSGETMNDFNKMKVAFPDMFERRLEEVAGNLFRNGKPGISVYYFSDEQLGQLLGQKDRWKLVEMKKDWSLAGNPNLKPELVNTVELGFSHDWRQVGVTAKAFYRRGTNTILPYTVLLPGGIAFTQPQNIGSSTTYGVESFITASAGKWWSSTASISLYNQSIEGDVNGENINSSLFSWYVKWANTFNFFQSTRAQLLFNYQAPTALPQGRRIAVYNVDLGFQQKIMQGRARLGLTVTDVFNTLENGSTVVTPDFKSTRISKSDTRAVLLTFAMTFGSAFREKLMDNKFSAE